jgi:hypothetical protein
LFFIKAFFCLGKIEKKVNPAIILKIVKTGNDNSEITQSGIESSDQDVVGEIGYIVG